jgi:hypothetical protein
MRPVLAPPMAATAAAAAAGVPGVRPVMAAGPGGGPRPLRLDASGREIDDAGNVIQAVRVPVATSLVSFFWGVEVGFGGLRVGGSPTINPPDRCCAELD